MDCVDSVSETNTISICMPPAPWVRISAPCFSTSCGPAGHRQRVLEYRPPAAEDEEADPPMFLRPGAEREERVSKPHFFLQSNLS